MKFDIDLIRERLTDRPFSRGKGYYEGGYVEIVGIDGDSVVAHVTGTDVYAVEMTPQTDDYSGSCTCPAFEDWQICKHLASVALSANDLTSAEIELARTRFGLIREGLALDSKQDLIERFVSLIKRKPDIFDELVGDRAGSDDTA